MPCSMSAFVGSLSGSARAGHPLAKQRGELIVPATGTGETQTFRFVVARSKFTSNAIQATGKSP
jgi:hypothetical protein